GHVLYSLGDYSLSAEKLVTRIDFYKRVGDFFSALPDLYMLTNAYRMARRYEEALDAGRLLIEYAQQSRSAKWFFYAHIALAGVLHDMKNYKDALREYTSCIVSGKILADELRDNESVVSAMINKGHVLKEMGDYASALIHFDAVLREEPEGFYLAYAYLGIGEVYYCKQQYGRVEKYFKRAEDIFKKLPPKTGQPYLSEINRLRMKLM
ncbi:tetratricopeptide repeat protein, partial [bacterium]|nr:tetratricopeptide repeat protein [bacterium]